MEQNDYVERHRKWQEVMISQLSNANNILLTLASGLLAFCFDKQLVKSIRIYLGAEIDWPVFFYAMSMVLLSLSLLYGILMLLTRLYDFRITRHITLIRKRCAEKNIKLSVTEFEYPTCWTRTRALFDIMFDNYDYILKPDIDDKKAELDAKFDKLRSLSHVLGISSWKYVKCQMFLFLFSAILYVVYLWV